MLNSVVFAMCAMVAAHLVEISFCYLISLVFIILRCEPLMILDFEVAQILINYIDPKFYANLKNV